MSHSAGHASSSAEESSGPDTRSVEEIERDLEQARASLESTVDAIGAKLDVKARGRGWVAQQRDRARTASRETVAVLDVHRNEVAFVVAGLVAASTVVLVWRARR